MRRILAVTLILVLIAIAAPLPEFASSSLVSASEPYEVISLRSANSKTFTDGSGQYYARFSQIPIHYLAGNGSWENINNVIEPAVLPWDYQMSRDQYTARFLSNFAAGQVVRWDAFNESVAFQPMELQWTNDLNQIQSISMPQNTGVVITNTPQAVCGINTGYQLGQIRWDDAYGEGRHFSWICDTGKLAKILELEAPLPAPASYIVSGGNAVARLNFIFAPSTNLQIYINNTLWDKSSRVMSTGFIEFRNATGQTLWYFEPQRVWDSAGNETIVTGELRRSGANLYVSIRVPYTWLSSAAYPVFIDPSLSFFSTSKDGYCSKDDLTDYYDTWIATSGSSASSTGSTLRFGQTFSTYYRIYRAYFPFDSGNLSDTCTVTNASVNVWGYSDSSSTDFLMTIQRGNSNWRPDPEDDGLVRADYNQAYYVDNLGQKSTSTFTITGYNVIDFHSADLGYVNKTGLTKVVMRSGREIDGNEPSGNEYVEVFTYERTGTTNDPFLSVTYTDGSVSAPTIVTAPATNIEATTATLNGNVTATGGEDPTVTVFWGDNDGGTNPATWDFSSAPTSPAQPQGVAPFYKNVTSLSTATLYYFNANGTNSGGTGWGSSRNFTTKPAAPTNVTATDGAYTDKVVISWSLSSGIVTGYKIYYDTTLLDTVGNVSSYNDTSAPAPSITPGSAISSDGLYTSLVALSLNGTAANNGTTRTYKVRAYNDAGDSADSNTDTGFRSVGNLVYQWQRSDTDSDTGYSNIGGATTAAYNDTAAPQGTITPGLSVASDGTYTGFVALSLFGNSTADGAGRYWRCGLNASGAAENYSASDRGYRSIGAPAYQWRRSFGESASNYSDIDGATSGSYNDTGAPKGIITPGSTAASDGTSGLNVSLSFSGNSTQNGAIRYYVCNISADGAESQLSVDDSGYRIIGALNYQWQRSFNATAGNYSDIVGANSSTYQDSDAPAPTVEAGNATASDGTSPDFVILDLINDAYNNGDLRYYQCNVTAAGADDALTTADSGYRGALSPGYQWLRSDSDSDGNYTELIGATTVPYNDLDGASAPDGRYYLVAINMSGAESANSTSDRGYKLVSVPPIVTAHNATDITGVTAVLRGEILDTGGDNCDLIGFEYGLSSGNYTYSSNMSGDYGAGNFSKKIFGLQINTHYYWRALAQNGAGTNYSAELEFWTLAIPLAPTAFTATILDNGNVELSWVKGIGADNTSIRSSTANYPQSVTDGSEVYFGNGTSIILTDLDLSQHTYYYSAWSENTYGYSTDHAETNVSELFGIAQILFVLGFCGFALWQKRWYIRMALSLSVVIWGVFTIQYNSIAAIAFIAIGVLLFIYTIFKMRSGTAERSTVEEW